MLSFNAKFWVDTKYLSGAVDVWIPWQPSRVSRSRPTKIDPCGWTVKFFFPKDFRVDLRKIWSETESQFRFSSPSELLAATLDDSSCHPTWRPHTNPIKFKNIYIAATLPKWTLDNQKLASGLIRMCSFQFWSQKWPIFYFEACCILMQPTNTVKVS